MKSKKALYKRWRIVPECCVSGTMRFARLALILTTFVLLINVARGEKDQIKDFPGLTKPRILYDANSKETSGYFLSVAFTQDGTSIIVSFRRYALGGLPRLLRQGVGEVRSFDLAGEKDTSRVIITAPNDVFRILTTPSGACQKPLLLARSRHAYPKEIAVLRAGEDGSKESIVGQFQFPRADKITGHVAFLFCLAASPAAKTLILGTSCSEWKGIGASATVTWWGDVKAWDLKTGKPRFTDAWEGNQVLDIAYSPDGKLVAAGGGHSAPTLFSPNRYNGRAVCWEEDFAKKRFDISLPHHQVHCLAFSPDSRTLVTGGGHGVVKWIDVTQGKVVKSLDVASRSGKSLGRVESLAFSPSGNLLVAGVGSWNRGNKWGSPSSKRFRKRGPS